jgi:DNA-binding transcriptional ArsR family regulator
MKGPLGSAEARTTDPVTSHEAAGSVRGEISAKLQLLVVRLVTLHPAGLICSEMVALSGLEWNTISPRLKPLRRLGLIHDSGKKRPGPSGRRQIVWMLGPYDPLL